MTLHTLPALAWPRDAGWLIPGENCTELAHRIVLRALRDVGIVETPLGSNRGTRIDAMTRRAGLNPPQWWCAIWAGAVFADAGAKVPRGYPLTDNWLPYVVPEPVVGAAILYGLRKKGPVRPDMDAHHIGIVVRLEPVMLTIEGNRGYAGATNDGVAVDIGPVVRKDILGYFHPVAAEQRPSNRREGRGMIIDAVKGAIALIIIVALACGGFLGWQEWREIQRERHAVAEAMVAREAAVVAEMRDSLRDARGELEAALVAGRSVIGGRGAASLRRPKPPPPMLESIEKVDADSLRGIIGGQQRALISLRAWGDSIEAQLVVARDTLARVLAAAERYRLYAERTIGAGARQISAMQVVIDTPRPRRRWGVGGAGGYCALDDRRNGSVGLRHGPGVCVGMSFNFQ